MLLNTSSFNMKAFTMKQDTQYGKVKKFITASVSFSFLTLILTLGSNFALCYLLLWQGFYPLM